MDTNVENDETITIVPKEGTVLVFSRFVVDLAEIEGKTGISSNYALLASCSVATLFEHINLPLPDAMTAKEMSDALVKAFDYGFAAQFGFATATFGWIKDELLIRQHST